MARELRNIEATRSAFLIALSADEVIHLEGFLKSEGFDMAATKPLMPVKLQEILIQRK